MKRILYLALIVAFANCNQSASKEQTATSFSEEAEKAAIMKTIEAETDCFYKRNYDCWKKHFIQKDYAFQAWSNGDGTFDAKTGWPAVDKKIGDYIKNNPTAPGTSSHPRVERKNMIIHFFSNDVAYLVWDQYNGDKESKTFLHSKDERIMEKENGEWKIANVSSFWNYKNKIPSDSLQYHSNTINH